MSDVLDRIRATAMLLPEVEERTIDGLPSFFVAGEPFARIRHDRQGNGATTLYVRTADTDELAVDLSGELDWPLLEDRVARSWELAAPARLLEAGGR